MNKIFSLLHFFCFACLALSCSNEDDYTIINRNDWKQLSNGKVIGSHRGLLGYPENSYEAIIAAIDAGYKVVEIDIARTKDGVFVVHHDATIDRCSDGNGYVKDYTYEELQKFDFGYYLGGHVGIKLQSLEQILRLCKDRNVAIELDLSNNEIILDEYVEPIYDIVNKLEMVPMVLFCGNMAKCQLLHEIDRMTNLDLTVWSKEDINTVQNLKSLNGNTGLMYITIPLKEMTDGVCDLAHSKGLKVECWTASSQDEMNSFFNIGADYVLVNSNILW